MYQITYTQGAGKRTAKETTTDGTPHYAHKLDVYYEGQHHAVTSFDEAWHMALAASLPVRITDLEQ